VLPAAWASGVRYPATAPVYAHGISEPRVGDFLVDQPRAYFVLTT
jgi:D-threo-aldose 1-dehydrogenase